MTLDPLVPNQTVLQCRHPHRFRHSINPTPANLSSPALQRQCVSCFINQSRHNKNRLPQRVVESISYSQRLKPFHKPLLLPQTRQQHL
ncbi:hypothetical protein ES319_D06G138400v1 [Gossypium barbadense]|uniref:Uncharacterized protein n=3 Tax=Gossypium TaxID=3633 RepID=A0A5J5R576_GOSBA|nr:hypothetical protein ES319_D06G138400v1 [Gossypium barbadense]TYG64962.1 hypothetical protein ES288_D06G148000v1 [Gossypium darwinii]TYG64963.1 hypothetical protein ES288_D06G148000v1 [Gossypium darwinii]TYH66855.1 hypothetical protein ES332_D06G150700v1 [Gossypium tomentosum]